MSKLGKVVALLSSCAVLVLLSGCITTTDSVYSQEASPEKALEQRLSLARQYIGDGNWSDAERNLNLAVQIDSNSAEVYEAFALVYQSTGEFELAERNFRKALSIESKFSRARNNYAAFLFSQQRYQEAEVELIEVVADALYSGRPRAFVNLGLCRLQLADPDGAEEAFVRALSMDRTNSIALLEAAELRYNAEDYTTSSRYYGVYRNVVRPQSPRGLWLGVRLAKVTGDRDAEGSFAMALRNMYPQSDEYQAYQQAQN